jgi:hypothetical protein
LPLVHELAQLFLLPQLPDLAGAVSEIIEGATSAFLLAHSVEPEQDLLQDEESFIMLGETSEQEAPQLLPQLSEFLLQPPKTPMAAMQQVRPRPLITLFMFRMVELQEKGGKGV